MLHRFEGDAGRRLRIDCAVLSGADDFEDISQWGRIKLPWLRGFLSLDYGIASPDTYLDK